MGKAVAYFWSCGDEVCDCWEPRIYRGTGKFDTVAGKTMECMETVWTGTFFSGPEPEDWATMKQELREAADRFGAEIQTDIDLDP